MERLSTIRSSANPSLKRVRAVLAGRERGLVALEGDRLIEDARLAGLRIDEILVAESRAERADAWEREGMDVRVVDDELLGKASSLVTSPGSIGVAERPRDRSLDELDLGGDTLALVVAGVSDPGNLGALARAAEAAGVSAFVVTADSASPWNAKALRGSMGSLLRLQVAVVSDPAEVAASLEANGVRQVAAGTRDGDDYRHFDWSAPIALWVTSETGEMPDAAAGFDAVTIPMRGEVESLNVAVAGALLLFEAAAADDGAPE